MKNKDEKARQKASQRVAEWMDKWKNNHPNNERNACEVVGEAAKYSPRTVEAFRQGRRAVTYALAAAIVKMDAEEHKAFPGQTIRIEYLMGEDDYETVDDARRAEELLNEAMDAWEEVSFQDQAFYWMFRMAGYSISLNSSGPNEGLHTVCAGGTDTPLFLLSPEEMAELRQELVDYTAYRVQRLMNRKEAAGDGVNEEADN